MVQNLWFFEEPTKTAIFHIFSRLRETTKTVVLFKTLKLKENRGFSRFLDGYADLEGLGVYLVFSSADIRVFSIFYLNFLDFLALLLFFVQI